LEDVILKLEQISHGKSFKLTAVLIDHTHGAEELTVELKEGKMPTEIFQQNILVYAIDNLNIELGELKEELENLK
jgi:hypothetical protein